MDPTRRRISKALLTMPMAFSFGLEAAVNWRRHLVLLELHGGNDGLNTIIPYTDPIYYEMRPRLAISRSQVLHLNENLGLHPSLEPLMPLWANGHMAIALGVGYPHPSLSHFRSIEIWETANSSKSYTDIGWLVRLINERPAPGVLPAHAVVLGRDDLGPLAGEGARVVSLKNLKRLRKPKSKPYLSSSNKANPLLAYVVQMQNYMDLAERRLVEKRLDQMPLVGTFPDHNFGAQMETAAKLIIGGSGIPIIKCSIGSFDTHAGQAARHRRLLMQLGEGLRSFSQAMKSSGKWDDVLIMTYSEFGRRPRENASGGTDHGTAAPHFFFGGKVNGGFYGEQPPLAQLKGLNLDYRLDFRTLYATVARQWLGFEADFLEQTTLPIIS